MNANAIGRGAIRGFENLGVAGLLGAVIVGIAVKPPPIEDIGIFMSADFALMIFLDSFLRDGFVQPAAKQLYRAVRAVITNRQPPGSSPHHPNGGPSPDRSDDNTLG